MKEIGFGDGGNPTGKEKNGRWEFRGRKSLGVMN